MHNADRDQRTFGKAGGMRAPAYMRVTFTRLARLISRGTIMDFARIDRDQSYRALARLNSEIR